MMKIDTAPKAPRIAQDERAPTPSPEHSGAQSAAEIENGLLPLWQPIVRVSTGDKGQRPERQIEVIEAWAARERVRLLPPVVDVGTSATKTDALDRPSVVEAVRRARAARAVGLVAEKVDRVCGQGSDELGHVRYVLQREHGLRIAFADQHLALEGTLSGNVRSAVDAEVRRERIDTDRQRIRGGIQTRRAKGLPVGGQAQQKVTADLVRLILSVRAEHPSWGAYRLAAEVSRRRGWTGVSATPEQRRKKVSHETVRKVISPNGPYHQTDTNS